MPETASPLHRAVGNTQRPKEAADSPASRTSTSPPKKMITKSSQRSKGSTIPFYADAIRVQRDKKSDSAPLKYLRLQLPCTLPRNSGNTEQGLGRLYSFFHCIPLFSPSYKDPFTFRWAARAGGNGDSHNGSHSRSCTAATITAMRSRPEVRVWLCCQDAGAVLYLPSRFSFEGHFRGRMHFPIV
jgi:hypothetical protein